MKLVNYFFREIENHYNPYSVVLHKLKLIRLNQKYGPISGKIMEKSLRKTNETDPDYVPEDEVRRKSSGVTCGMFEIFFFQFYRIHDNFHIP